MNTASPDIPGSFMDLLLDAVCVVDENGRFVYASAAFERIFGYTPEAMYQAKTSGGNRFTLWTAHQGRKSRAS